ncbi:MAG TPA: class I adenylate-forming enzyme family protein [Woeseiaceae bacterium]|nr:class I adenylate-forming enzyme family protein [Woeseiaceae bacterium]
MRTTPQNLVDTYTGNGWWGEETLGSLFAAAVAEAADRPALADPPNREVLVGGAAMRYTFGELDVAATELATALFAAGLRQGDEILVQLPNCTEIVLVYLAAAKLGLIVSPIAIQYGPFEIEHVTKVIEPKAYLAFERFNDDDYGTRHAGILNEGCRALLFENGAADSLRLSQDVESAQAACAEYVAGLVQDANDIFTICWTSGTTGTPKGVPRSHNHWLSSTLASEDSVRLVPEDIMLNPFPFINMAAIGGFLYYWLKLRNLMVLHHPFDPMVFLSQLQNEKINYTIAPPAVLTRLLIDKEQIQQAFDLSSVHTIGSGSAPLSPSMIRGFEEEFGIKVTNLFGSNEGAALVGNSIDIPDPEDRAVFFPRFGRPEHTWDNRLAAMMRTRLTDLDSGEEITEPGTPGELCISGPTVFDGYYKSDQDNVNVFTADGFFRTGDVFQIAGPHNEFYQFVGRCKDIIVRGGVNISPEELDAVLQDHPDILECAVCGYPDEIMGERIALFAVPNEGATVELDSVTQFLAHKGVAKIKWPEKLVAIEALPRNALNKILRNTLVDQLQQLPGNEP